ncbi:transcriptional regulator [Staphylococcus nepalensis]|jgi:LacI family transcriptional regulator|uniref:LacI family DNA-binding transcriptional regulator n=1 Tax=Staphylococcus TaxID=1279 RepID=UPI000BC2FFEA|nr:MULTISPECIES: LacI family DNA-binding transcriptional regulator [Staphylococcus]ATH60167.1 transcriptional regulator [Staphylococcus nepalensis]ATH65257.1 transcriptional regulator [Staphylococcus nepalensis]AWI44626.1 transcriptional regulator [Staphylococcus nepalensis]NWN84671.1 LacI family DNA-binding transcriptional regulator [Staphylococcus sp.]
MKAVTQIEVIFITTIKEVANLAGCSVATVSRVINNNGYVKEQTKKRIECAISELNYQPNEAARTLYKRKSKMIGLLLPDISNPFFTLIARGVEDIALSQGFQVLIGNSDNNANKARDYLSTFNSYNCVGVITTAFADKQVEKLLKSQNMPCVFVDRVNDVISGVSANHFEGGELQAQLILEGKPQNILIIHLDLKINTFKSRINGIESILKQYNVKYFYYESEQLTNEQAFISLIKNLKIDSIICSNDILAIETMAIIQQFKFKVPEDIQIVGYDNIPFSTMTFPNISTIDQSAYVLGQKAVSKLLNLKTNDYDKQLVLSPKRRGSIRF